jgi:Ca-activated chloride channel family protein
LRGVRETVNGDDSALYNALLDDAEGCRAISGRKVVVVFSNGPDNSSMVSPEDVDELAQSEGVPIYMISTREAKLDPASAAVFARMTASTGRRGVLRQELEGSARCLRFDPGRPGASVLSQLLPPTQSKSRLARHHRETYQPEI